MDLIIIGLLIMAYLYLELSGNSDSPESESLIAHHSSYIDNDIQDIEVQSYLA